MIVIFSRLAAVTMMVTLLIVSPAVAGTPLTDAYGGSGRVAAEVDSHPGVKLESGPGGSLPFTGFDALLMLGGGGMLLAVGVGMRRLARDHD